jgi:hypothetical protein
LGGSCYYLTNVTSTSATANDTCRRLYSNHSQLIRIKYPVELFYAAYELLKNGLSELLVQMDPHLITGKANRVHILYTTKLNSLKYSL